MLLVARHMASLIWRAAPLHIVVFLMTALLSAVAPVVVAWFTKLALDELVSPGPLAILVGLAAGLAVAGMLGALFPQVGYYLRSEIDRRAGLRANEELFAALDRLTGLSEFENPDFLDRLRLAQQSAAMPGNLVDQATQVGRQSISVLGFAGSLAVINPWFTVIVLVSAIPALIIELRLSRQRAAMLWKIGPVDRRQFFYRQLLSSVAAAKEIRLFGLGAFLRGRMRHELEAANSARREMDRQDLILQGVLALLATLVSGGGLMWVMTSAYGGAVSIGDISIFIASVASIQAGINGIVGGAANSHQQFLLFAHYVGILEEATKSPEPQEGHSISTLQQGVEFRDVWFRYSDDHPWILQGMSLFIPAGQATALVGKNGAGKSTIVKLLCRFYEPTRGSIHWDGVDISTVPARDLRDRLGVVFQDFMSYEFTAGDNIAVGDLSALDHPERLESAARQAGVHDHMMNLPFGYETLLTRSFFNDLTDGDVQAGVILSGGQWQRVALARAFLRADRDLMILDEPSSGLDAEAEHDMHSRLNQIRKGRTSVLISHRLGTVRDADRIVVISDGVVAEEGSHAELLDIDGVYRRLFALQAGGYVASADRRSSADLAFPGIL
ncbi:ABC transporter ATP-binding protein [Nonomuraea sp. NPDC049400]|uniref:ABC transporter ATP-binding protein n=1 Tax=Nonomuraea sp. NPDC049400 TaxID=3364352 RepID=UPI00378E9EBA